MSKTWEWKVTCSLCGFKSRWYRFHKVAQLRAIIHAVCRHPFGHTTVAARELGKPSRFTVCSRTDGTCRE